MKVKKSYLQTIIKEEIGRLSPEQRKVLREKLVKDSTRKRRANLKEESFNFSKDIEQIQDIIETLKIASEDMEEFTGGDRTAFNNVKTSIDNAITYLSKANYVLKTGAHRKKYN